MNHGNQNSDKRSVALRLLGLTAVAVFTAEALVMLLVEGWGSHLSLLTRVLLDAALLIACVVPTLYVMVFKEMVEQIRLREQAELEQYEWRRTLEETVEERTDGLRRANEDLLAEVQERARISMALNKALKEARTGWESLKNIVNAVQDGLVVVGTDGRLVFVNPAAEKLLQRNAYDLNGKTITEVFRRWTLPVTLDQLLSGTRVDESFILEPLENGWPAACLSVGSRFEWDGCPVIVLLIRLEDRTFSDRVKIAS